jgi:hypothetical protein
MRLSRVFEGLAQAPANMTLSYQTAAAAIEPVATRLEFRDAPVMLNACL